MYFITVSRKMGTNGHEIAKRVAKELGYSLYDRFCCKTPGLLGSIGRRREVIYAFERDWRLREEKD
jgi:Cytidylate kinase-like family